MNFELAYEATDIPSPPREIRQQRQQIEREWEKTKKKTEKVGEGFAALSNVVKYV